MDSSLQNISGSQSAFASESAIIGRRTPSSRRSSSSTSSPGLRTPPLATEAGTCTQRRTPRRATTVRGSPGRGPPHADEPGLGGLSEVVCRLLPRQPLGPHRRMETAGRLLPPGRPRMRRRRCRLHSRTWRTSWSRPVVPHKNTRVAQSSASPSYRIQRTSACPDHEWSRPEGVFALTRGAAAMAVV